MLLTLALGACTGTARAPVESSERPGGQPAPVTRQGAATVGGGAGNRAEYRVVSGDTLFSIAFRYGLDYRDVAAWNGIGEPYLIRPGQRIVLQRPTGGIPARADDTRTVVKAASAPPAKKASSSKPKRAPSTSAAAPLRWRWPAPGRHAQKRTTFGKIGLEIYGERGTPVQAAAAGQVVYAGSGLIGYGQLIIIKHDDVYLSAYAHNDSLLVQEGAVVKAGQAVARMGDTGSKQVKLHFEIRRNGKPVPPLEFLPSRRQPG